jgi:hypothetical protein
MPVVTRLPNIPAFYWVLERIKNPFLLSDWVLIVLLRLD